jgi:hypothetical protein
MAKPTPSKTNYAHGHNVEGIPERTLREIRHAPKEKQDEIRKIVAREKIGFTETHDIVEAMKIEINLDKSPEEILKTLQAVAEQEYKKEAAKKRTLVNSLKELYPENVLTDVVNKFGREKHETICRLVYRYVEQLTKLLTPKQKEAALNKVQEGVLIS